MQSAAKHLYLNTKGELITLPVKMLRCALHDVLLSLERSYSSATTRAPVVPTGPTYTLHAMPSSANTLPMAAPTACAVASSGSA